MKIFTYIKTMITDHNMPHPDLLTETDVGTYSVDLQFVQKYSNIFNCPDMRVIIS